MHSTTFDTLTKYRKYKNLISSNPQNSHVYRYKVQKYTTALQKGGFSIQGFRNGDVPEISPDSEETNQRGGEFKYGVDAKNPLREDDYQDVRQGMMDATNWLGIDTTDEEVLQQIILLIDNLERKIDELGNKFAEYKFREEKIIENLRVATGADEQKLMDELDALKAKKQTMFANIHNLLGRIKGYSLQQDGDSARFVAIKQYIENATLRVNALVNELNNPV